MVSRTKRKLQKRKTSPWIFFLLLFGAIFAAYRLYVSLYDVSPKFYFIVLLKDGEPIKIINGETVQLHPKNRIRISEISTNVFFNYGVRLSAIGFDAPALLFEEVQISELVPDNEKLNRFSLRIEIKRFNQVMGHVDFLVEPFIEDWLDKADRSIGDERKTEILEKARELFSDDRRIKDRLIQEYMDLGKWKEASLLLEEKANEEPDMNALTLLLNAYREMNDKNGSISVIKKILKISPEDLGMRLKLAELLEETGQLKESIAEYEKILEMVPDEEKLVIYKNLGFKYSEINDPEKAIIYYLKALETDKEDADLYYNLSILYEKADKKGESELFLDKALRLNPNDVKSRLRLAESNLEKKKLVEAEGYLQDVLKRDPNSMDALLLMLKIAELKEDKNTLKVYYQKILDLEPDNRTIINNLGVLEYETGNYEKAIPYFEKLLKFEPGDQDMHFFLFEIYRRLQKDRQAFEEAGKLINLGSKDLNLYHFIFEYLNNREDFKTMSEVMKEAIVSHPKEDSLRKYLILAYLKLGKEGDAIEQIKEILKTNPGDIPLLLQLGKLLEKADRLEESAGVYLKIMELSPGEREARDDYIKALTRLASSQEKQGQYNKAIENFNKIIQLSPGHEQAGEAYLRLRFKVLPDETE